MMRCELNLCRGCIVKVISCELWSEHLLNKESIALTLDIVIDGRDSFLELGYLFLELFWCHLHRLTLQLLHDCFVN